MASVMVGYEETEETQDLMATGHLRCHWCGWPLAHHGLIVLQMRRWTHVQANGRFDVYAAGSHRHQQPDLRGTVDDIVRTGMMRKGLSGMRGARGRGWSGGDERRPTATPPTYETRNASAADDIYDLASITKVASTTLALMHLVDEGKVDLDKPLGHYLPELDDMSVAHARMGLRDILTHQAGLKAFVPFYTKFMKDGRNCAELPSRDTATETQYIRAGGRQGCTSPTAYRDSMLSWVVRTPLGKKGEYVYSDMGYYLLQEVIERHQRHAFGPLREQERFYGPLGRPHSAIKPYGNGSRSRASRPRSTTSTLPHAPDPRRCTRPRCGHEGWCGRACRPLQQCERPGNGDADAR
jgi:hypothetical protein